MPIFIGLLIILTLLVIYYFTAPASELKLIQDKGAISIEKSLIQNYLETYCLQKFPKHEVKTKVTLKRNQVHLFLKLPPCPIEKQSKTLFQVTSDLHMLFYHLLGPDFDLEITNRFHGK